MIRCWTEWRLAKAAIIARPRPVVTGAAVTGVRRVRRARRVATAGAVLYPTIVCSVIGVGGTAGALFPWRDHFGAQGPGPRYEFTGDLSGSPPQITPTPVPEPESLLLLGTAVVAMMLIGFIRREPRR